MLVWPEDLPQSVDRQGYRYQLGDGRLKSSTDTGGGKVRRRDSNPPALISAPLTLTVLQKSRLEDFWEFDCKGGVKPFLFPAIAVDGVALFTAGGEPLDLNLARRWFCRFDPDQPPPAFDVYTGITWRTVLNLWRLA